MLATCHCTRCRKVGTSTFVLAKRETFAWVAGEEMVTCFEPGEPYKYARCFCRTCGTSLGEVTSTADSFPVAAHCLDSETGLEVRFHEFVAEKPAWFVIGDNAKQFDGHPSPSPSSRP